MYIYIYIYIHTYIHIVSVAFRFPLCRLTVSAPRLLFSASRFPRFAVLAPIQGLYENDVGPYATLHKGKLTGLHTLKGHQLMY